MNINTSYYNYLCRVIARGEDIEKIHFAFKENEDYNEEELNKRISDIENEQRR